MSIVILTDSCCDLPVAYLQREDLVVQGLSYHLDEREIMDRPGEATDYRSFYDAMRGGARTSTSQVNAEAFVNIMEPLLEAGKDILNVSFSSALSGTYQNSVIAVEMLKEKYPGRRIATVESLCASMGQGLLIHLLLEKRDAGVSFEELADYAAQIRHRIAHWFTVDDLQYLRRGGRVSGAAAFMGTMLDIKPVLHVDPEGRLVPVEKVRGRKKSIKSMAKHLEDTILDRESPTIFISHGDAKEEEVEQLIALVKERVRNPQITVGYIGPIIGSHSGPGTMAIFFLAKER